MVGRTDLHRCAPGELPNRYAARTSLSISCQGACATAALLPLEEGDAERRLLTRRGDVTGLFVLGLCAAARRQDSAAPRRRQHHRCQQISRTSPAASTKTCRHALTMSSPRRPPSPTPFNVPHRKAVRMQPSLLLGPCTAAMRPAPFAVTQIMHAPTACSRWSSESHNLA